VDFQLREYRKEDFERLWAIDHACFPPGISYSRFELMAYIKRSRSFTLVGERRGERDKWGRAAAEIGGFIVAEVGRDKIGHIITIDVVEAARGTGLGSRLLAAAEERLRESACWMVYLEAAVDNRAALGFYKKHEYFVLKTIPRYYSNGVDAFVLKKDLLPRAADG
jgi:ribosomal protein S18 acetylase RimI-like enzyme